LNIRQIFLIASIIAVGGTLIFLSIWAVGIDVWIASVTSQPAITLIIGAAGVTVSAITYIFQVKQLKLRGLVEVFKELNLRDHREARRVMYGERSDNSYDLFHINRPDAGGTVGELDRVSRDIVRGDMNNAATLIAHRLMDGSIFVKEYWWIILRCWDKVKDEIIERRNSGTGASGYMHNLEELKDKAEAYARKYHSKDYNEYLKKYGTESSI
jgi:hypothetical protein